MVTNETVDVDDTIGHLFLVSIRFSFKQADAKTVVCNETYCPIFEKQKTIDAAE